MSPSQDKLKDTELSLMMENILYDLLISTEKSEEYGKDFLKMVMELRRENYSVLKKVSKYFGQEVQKEITERKFSENEKKSLMRRCLKKAIRDWKRKNE